MCILFGWWSGNGTVAILLSATRESDGSFGVSAWNREYPSYTKTTASMASTLQSSILSTDGKTR